MGWWNSLWSSSSSEDPVGKLDPNLRKFLEKESPDKYDAQTPEPAEPQPQPRRSQPPPSEPAQEGQQQQRSVPKESQFQDGRYADIWKTYRPLADIEAETKTDHEKLMDVLGGYKDRKRQIGKAALENCALEQLDWKDCMTNPSAGELMTLCRKRVKKFEKCYTTQQRLLKALGYMSTMDRSPEIEEAIQMHADKLYQRTVAQEEEIDAAVQAGRPPPQFPPLVPRKPQAAPAAAGAANGEMELNAEQMKILKARLEAVPEAERPTEEAYYREELRAKQHVANQVQDLWKRQEAERLMRIETGQETLWDKLVNPFKSNDNSKK